LTLSLPDALAYGRIPLVIALALAAGFQRPRWCFWVLLLTVALEVAQRTLAKQKGDAFQTSPVAAKVEPFAEAALYVAVPVVFVRLFPGFLRAHLLAIAALIAAYLVTELYGYFKFKRLTNYQTHGARLGGVALGITGLTLFWTERIDWLLYVSVVVVLASFAEEVAISAVLPEWRAGVTSLWHARRIVKRLQSSAAKAGRSASPEPKPAGEVAIAEPADERQQAEQKQSGKPRQATGKSHGGNRKGNRKGGSRKSGR